MKEQLLESSIVDVILTIRQEYGSQVFLNSTLVNNLLCDLAAKFPKERIQIRNLLEMGGFAELSAAGAEYPLVRRKLIKRYMDTYFVERKIAEWAVDVLGAALGRIERENVVITEEAPTVISKPQRVNHHRHIESTAVEWVYTVKIKNGFFYIVGRKKDGTILKSRVEPDMLMRLGRLKVLLLHQKRVVQICARYTEVL